MHNEKHWNTRVWWFDLWGQGLRWINHLAIGWGGGGGWQLALEAFNVTITYVTPYTGVDYSPQDLCPKSEEWRFPKYDQENVKTLPQAPVVLFPVSGLVQSWFVTNFSM